MKEKTVKLADHWISEEDKKLRKQALCDHLHWVKSCSHCGAILGSEKTEEHEHIEILI